MAYYFIFLMVVFEVQRVFNFHKFQFIIIFIYFFTFKGHVLGDLSKNLTYTQRFHPRYFFRYFRVLAFIFRYVIFFVNFSVQCKLS